MAAFLYRKGSVPAFNPVLSSRPLLNAHAPFKPVKSWISSRHTALLCLGYRTPIVLLYMELSLILHYRPDYSIAREVHFSLVSLRR